MAFQKSIIDIDLWHFILENHVILWHHVCHNYYPKSIIDIDFMTFYIRKLCNFMAL